MSVKRKNGKEHIGISVACFCHDGKGNFVLNKRGLNARDEHGRWDLCAGAIEFGETAEEAMRKELQEEICAEPLQHEFLGFRDIHREQEGIQTHWISLDFKVLVNPSSVKNGEPHKLDKVEWFTLDKLPKPLHSQAPLFFKKYKGLLED